MCLASIYDVYADRCCYNTTAAFSATHKSNKTSKAHCTISLANFIFSHPFSQGMLQSSDLLQTSDQFHRNSKKKNLCSFFLHISHPKVTRHQWRIAPFHLPILFFMYFWKDIKTNICNAIHTFAMQILETCGYSKKSLQFHCFFL